MIPASLDWLWPLAAAAVLGACSLALFLRLRLRRSVFLSYRRGDDAAVISHIQRGLQARFGGGVFSDVALSYGQAHRRSTLRRLRDCDAALVIIGPSWLSSEDDEGLLIDRPDDVVRGEVTLALDSGALVIPVLIGGAQLPSAVVLPPELRELADLGALPVTDGQLDEAVGRLIAATLAAPVRYSPWMTFLAHVAAVLVLALFSFSGGFTPHQVSTMMLMVAPLFTATGAVVLVHQLSAHTRHARTRHLSAYALWAPLSFTFALAGITVLKAWNLGIGSFESFKLALGGIEVFFAAHTGIVLSKTFENRSQE